MSLPPSTPEAYRLYLGQTFAVARPDRATEALRLDAVDTKIDDENQLCFSLLFRPQSGEIPRGIHRLSHPQAGEFDLSLEPVRVRPLGLCYEAVFNLLRDGEP